MPRAKHAGFGYRLWCARTDTGHGACRVGARGRWRDTLRGSEERGTQEALEAGLTIGFVPMLVISFAAICRHEFDTVLFLEPFLMALFHQYAGGGGPDLESWMVE